MRPAVVLLWSDATGRSRLYVVFRVALVNGADLRAEEPLDNVFEIFVNGLLLPLS